MCWLYVCVCVSLSRCSRFLLNCINHSPLMMLMMMMHTHKFIVSSTSSSLSSSLSSTILLLLLVVSVWCDLCLMQLQLLFRVHLNNFFLFCWIFVQRKIVLHTQRLLCVLRHTLSRKSFTLLSRRVSLSQFFPSLEHSNRQAGRHTQKFVIIIPFGRRWWVETERKKSTKIYMHRTTTFTSLVNNEMKCGMKTTHTHIWHRDYDTDTDTEHTNVNREKTKMNKK